MRRFQSCQRLVPRNRWKRIEELVEAVASFEVINQVAQRHSSADKDRRPAQDVTIAVDNECLFRHREPDRTAGLYQRGADNRRPWADEKAFYLTQRFAAGA